MSLCPFAAWLHKDSLFLYPLSVALNTSYISVFRLAFEARQPHMVVASAEARKRNIGFIKSSSVWFW